MAKDARKKEKTGRKIGPGIGIWMAAGVFLLYLSAAPGALVLLALAVFLILRFRREEKTSAQYFDTVVRPAVFELFEEAVCQPNGGFARETILSLGLLRRTPRYRSRHRIAGRFRGVSFEAAAVKLSYRSYTIGAEPFTSLFDGLFLALPRPRDDHGVIRILPAGYGKAPAQSGGANGSRKGAGEMRPAPVSSPRFAEAFCVWAQDPEHAAALCSEAFCDGVLKLRERAGVPVLLCFSGDRLFVGLDLKEPPPLDAPAAEEEAAQRGEAVRDTLRLIGDCAALLAAHLPQP